MSPMVSFVQAGWHKADWNSPQISLAKKHLQPIKVGFVLLTKVHIGRHTENPISRFYALFIANGVAIIRSG